jgi:hypothetical protein
MTEPGYTPEWLSLREPADTAARPLDLLSALLAYLIPAPVPLVVRDLGCGTGAMGRWLSPRLPTPQHWILHDNDPGLLTLATASLTGLAVAGRSAALDGGPGGNSGPAAADRRSAGNGGPAVDAGLVVDGRSASGDGTSAGNGGPAVGDGGLAVDGRSASGDGGSAGNSGPAAGGGGSTGSGGQAAVPVVVTAERRDVTGLTAADLAGTSLVTASALLDLLTAGEVDALAAACVAAGCAALLSISVAGRV